MSRNTAKLKTHKEFELNLLDFAYSLLSFHFYLLYLLINILIWYGSKEFESHKSMLAERNQTNKWLAEQVGKSACTFDK